MKDIKKVMDQFDKVNEELSKLKSQSSTTKFLGYDEFFDLINEVDKKMEKAKTILVKTDS